MLSPTESEILLAVAQAATQPSAWPRALRLLAVHLQADRVCLSIGPGGWDQDGPVERSGARFAGLRLGRVYTAEELEERAIPGLPDATDLRAIGTEGGWLWAARAQNMFRAVDSAALSAFAPHVGQALATRTAWEATQGRLRAHEQVARRLALGLVWFDAQGRPSAQDEIAQALLAQAGVEPRMVQGVASLAPGLEIALLAQPDGTQLGVLRATELALPAPEVIAQALGVSLAEARLARALGMGDTLAGAAARLGLTVETARAYSRQIFAKTGLSGQPALMRRLWTSALVLA